MVADLSCEVLQETNFDHGQLSLYIDQNEPLLVDDQRRAYLSILSKVQSRSGSIVFLDAPGGTGKTFVINLLLAKLRQNGQVAVGVASSGIAATLLTGGRTAHSVFKLPLNLRHSETPTYNISKGSGAACVLKKCRLIVWDECTMAHKLALENLNRTLQDIRSDSN